MKIPEQGRLAGRRIVITGAASGIGRATAHRFIAEGARTVLLDLDAAGVTETLGDGGGLAIRLDINNSSEVDEAIAQGANHLGGLDGVVNAAGIMLTGPTEDFSFEQWRKIIDVNLTGSFNVAKCCLPWLKQRPGSTIVNIASATGLLPNSPGVVAYAASKGGVISMSRALASDLAPDIRVNCICPGLVNTPLGEDFLGNTDHYALKRYADPSEIANAVLFLTSDESSYVTGATLAADGGRSFH